MIECISKKGNIVKVPKDKITFRPSVYAVIKNRGDILMLYRADGKIFFPGGGVNVEETLPEALRREVNEETGITINIDTFLTFRELFFYNDSLDQAYHKISFYYICEPVTLDLLDEIKVDKDDAGMPTWTNLRTLQKNNDRLGPIAKEIVQII